MQYSLRMAGVDKVLPVLTGEESKQKRVLPLVQNVRYWIASGQATQGLSFIVLAQGGIRAGVRFENDPRDPAGPVGIPVPHSAIFAWNRPSVWSVLIASVAGVP